MMRHRRRLSVSISLARTDHGPCVPQTRINLRNSQFISEIICSVRAFHEHNNFFGINELV